MCTYDYLPFVSCHSKNTKVGIFKVETIRLMRTNLFQASFEAEVEFTFRKLIDRGSLALTFGAAAFGLPPTVPFFTLAPSLHMRLSRMLFIVFALR